MQQKGPHNFISTPGRTTCSLTRRSIRQNEFPCEDQDMTRKMNCHFGAPLVVPLVDATGTWVDGNINGYTNVDESITFAFDITNSGTKTLHNFCLSASKLGAGCLECTSPTTLPQGNFFSCTVSYQVRQIDRKVTVTR